MSHHPKQKATRAGVYAYRDRRNRKRSFRRLWIARINAAARREGLTYAQFMAALRAVGIGLDRKMLADIAVRDAELFGKIAAVARAYRQTSVSA